MVELLTCVSLTTILFHFVEEQALKKVIFKRLVNAIWQFGALNNCYSKRERAGLVVHKGIQFYNIFSGAFVKRAKLGGSLSKSACFRWDGKQNYRSRI